MDDLLRDFLTESAENLAKLDNDLVELEQRPNELSLLNSVFRTIHTIKGTCGFIGLSRLEGVAHAAENVLDGMRAGRIAVTSDVLDDVLAAVDSIKAILAHVEQTEQEPEGDDAALVTRLERWLDGSPHAAAAVPADAAPVAAPETVEPVDLVPVAPANAMPAAPTPVMDEGSAEVRGPSLDSTLRVSVELLDRLMNLVGELALDRNQLTQLAATRETSEFAKPIQHLNRVTTDLLEAVLKTRMQPIGNAWTKLPRLIRDLSHASGKRIDLVMQGAETELDRQVLQAIQDPLTHMLRNSADHGIESTARRREAGKSETGTIRLSARHEGGHVVVDIADDGAGIAVDRVRQKAVERGLVRADAADALSDAQILRFIFEPGFSTAEKVTNVSGRGVGMDVVRSNIEAIGGTVELSTVLGKGTTVRIKIPLTLAIISALLVGAAGETFAVPQIGVVELVRIAEEHRELIETVHGARFLRLRDLLLPLVDLSALLRLPEGDPPASRSVVVCQVGEARFGLVVDEVFDTQEVVVKPVGRLVKHLTAYAGCTITGDGRVIMILDAGGIAALAGVTDRKAGDESATRAETSRDDSNAATESVLLFDAGMGALQAVPLSLVARLEEIPARALEQADGRTLVQYRGALIPVIGANPACEMHAIDPRPVIVFSDRNRTMGLAVDAIRDIVDVRLTIERRGDRPGVLGVAVIAERATEVIDTHWFLRQAYGDWFASSEHGGADAQAPRVLLVDDSRFFLGLLAPMLRAAGYAVTTSLDGKDAIARVVRGETFDLVLSDIDMQAVDGFELARALRAQPSTARVPLIALTARTSAEDRAKGLAAGFDRYLTKLDRDAVLTTIQQLLASDSVAA
ncbi:MAG: hybrid sensor histidine kinase/response regulator [Gemmatimonadaceae bacterium]|nr:hybrid sensor histidine kinase/response regulator [Gemmatimonadaceae bacterium]